MGYKLEELIDVKRFQSLQDRLNKIYNFPSAIIDNEGNILTATAWQDACTKFHRNNEQCERECIKSDQYIKDHLHEANPAVSYRCPHGLIDNALPIIIEGQHLGNFFTGQFFLEDPDLDFFKEQAAKYGFDEKAYLKAIKEVPIWNEEQRDNYLLFIQGLIQVITSSALRRLKEIEVSNRILEEEARYRTIINTAHEGFIIIDPDFRVLEVNDEYCIMSGYSREELLRMTIPELDAIDNEEVIRKRTEKIFKENGGLFESIHRRKDGSLYDVEISVNYIPDKTDKLYSFVRDISARKKYENELKQSEAKNKAIIKALPDILFRLSKDGIYLDYSAPKHTELYKKPGEFLGRHFNETLPVEIRDAFRKKLKECIKSKESQVFEYKLGIKGQGIRYYESRITLSTQDEVIVLVRDITNRVNTDKELKRNQFYLKKSQEIGLIGTWEYDLIEDKITWTDEVYHIFEINKNIAPSYKIFLDSVHPDDKDYVDQKWNEAFKTKQFDIEHRILAGKKIKWVREKGDFEYDEKGRVVRVIGVTQDISDRIKAEEEVKKNKDFFEQLFLQSATSTQLLDAEGWCIRINPKLSELFGVRPEDIEGRKYNILKDGEIIKTGVIDKLKRVFDHYETVTWEVNFDIGHASETTGVKVSKPVKKWFSNKAYPILNDKGKLENVIIQHEDISERKNAEEDLKEVRFFNDNLIDTANVIIVALDHEGYLKIFNPTAERITGYSKEEIQNKNWFETIVPKKRYPKVWKNFNSIMVQGISKKYENPILTKSGEERIVSWSSNSIVKNGKTYGIISFGIDITDQKNAERDLIEAKEMAEENEKKFYELFNNSPNAISLSTVEDGKIIDINKNFTQVFGFKKEEVTGLTSEELNMWVDYSARKKIQQNIRDKGYLSNIELPFRTKNGKILNISASVSIIKFKNHPVVITSLIDISSRIKAEQELKLAKESAEKSESYLYALLSEIDDIIVSRDLHNKVVYFNGAFDKITRKLFNKKACVGMDTLELLPDKTYKFWNNILNKVKKGEKNVEEFEYAMPDGKTEYYISAHAPIIQNKKIIGTLEITRDITSFKEKEIELKNAKEKAEQSDKLKSEFLNNMSHEIRTPKNGIMGFANRLNAPGVNEDKRKYYIDIIRNCSEQLLRIIDDILEISRLETKQVKVYESKVCLNDLVMQLFAIFDMKAKENKIPLYVKKTLNDKESTIYTDELKINKILSNIIENALKYTESGFIEIGYMLKNSKIELYVEDTGVGIKEESKLMIFERFSQEEKSITSKARGLGLGLSIAKENTELLGGTISVQSAKGKGSKFIISLPYKPVFPVKKPKNAPGNIKSDSVNKPAFSVLIAEDEEVNFLYLEELINTYFNNDVKIYHAKDGKEALSYFKNESIDIIFMDIKMPEMDGYQATIKIREKDKDIPIIAQTAYASAEDKNKIFSLGFNDYIPKPLDESKLYDCLKQFRKP